MSGSSGSVQPSATFEERLQAAQALAAKAVRKEREGDLSTAYSLCIQTAQAYLWLIRNAEDDHAREPLKLASSRVLSRAEKIKAVKRDVRPALTSCLDELEQEAVLYASSVISGHRYALWQALPSDGEAEVQGKEMYSDPEGHFRLSSFQRERLANFRRVTEMSSSPLILARDMDALDISQSCVTDCSVISALIACLQHDHRFQSGLALDCLHPRDPSGWPRLSPDGRYTAKLHCNGSFRRVVIDDYLPIDASGRLLCASAEGGKGFWPALLEKAYVKLHGGYAMLGSIPSTDIHTFTGWIPESISLRDTSFRSEQTWRRILRDFDDGSCVLTLGTGKAEVQLPDGRNLASEHAFAVLSAHEDANGRRYVDLADPWSHSELRQRLDSLNISEGATASRTVRVSWELVCSRFHSIYCNHNPSRFEHTFAVHSQCDLDDVFLLDLQMGPSPSLEPDPIWILVSRHFDKPGTNEYLGLHAYEDAPLAGSRSLRPLPTAANLSNGTHILLKYQPERPQARVKVLLVRQGVSQELRFSVSMYSNGPMRVADGSPGLPFSEKILGKWTGKSSGGSAALPTYINNPQYAFAVPESATNATLRAVLHLDDSVPVNLKLVRSPGTGPHARLDNLETATVIADSSQGAYSRGTACVVLPSLQPGSYTLIPSTFEAGVAAEFNLRVHASFATGVKLLPQEDAGRFTKLMRGNWTETSAGGGPRNASYRTNPTYRVRIPSACLLRVRLQLSTQTQDAPINVAIFAAAQDAEGAFRLSQEVASSGAYSTFVAGCVTPEIRMRPSTAGCLIVPSIYSPGVLASYTLTVLSDHPVSLELLS